MPRPRDEGLEVFISTRDDSPCADCGEPLIGRLILLAGERGALCLAFVARIRELFPSCPEGRERAIAEHACRRSSGRVGRSAAGRELAPDAVRLAGRPTSATPRPRMTSSWPAASLATTPGPDVLAAWSRPRG